MSISPSSALRRASQRINAEFDGGKHGVTMAQTVVLRALLDCGPGSQKALIARTGIDRSTISDMLRRLAEKRWVKRERSDHDCRVQLASITKEGSEALRTAENELDALEAGIMLLVPRADRAAFKRGLAAIAEAHGVG